MKLKNCTAIKIMLSKILLKKHAKYLFNIGLKAKGYAAKNIPLELELSLEGHIQDIIGFYKGLASMVSQQLMGLYHHKVGKATTLEYTELQRHAHNQKQGHIEAIRQLDLDKATFQKLITKALQPWVYPLIVFLGIGESVFNVPAFLGFGDSFIIALFVGTLLGIFQTISAKILVVIIRDIEDPMKQKRMAWIAVGGAVIISAVLGGLRYVFCTIEDHVSPLWINPIVFGILNLLVVVCAAVVAYTYWPDAQSLAAITELNRIEKAIIIEKNALKRLEAKITIYVSEHALLIKLYEQFSHAEQEVLEQVNSHYVEGVGTFKSEFVQRRTTTGTIPCFSTSLPPLSVTPLFTY